MESRKEALALVAMTVSLTLWISYLQSAFPIAMACQSQQPLCQFFKSSSQAQTSR
jgi:hypothetical protein